MYRLNLYSVVLLLVLLVGCSDDNVAPSFMGSNGTGASNGTSNGTQSNGTSNGTASNGTTTSNGTTAGCTNPSAEICDEADNDCDGRIDEGLTTTDINNCGACGVVCARDNAVTICQSGGCVLAACMPGFDNADGNPDNGCEASNCMPTNAGVEACDEADNDCDGEIDEDFQVGRSSDHCLACNTPCDLDNASALCSNGACLLDDCDAGWEDLDGLQENGCEAEICRLTNGGVEGCDSVDNDCDGEIDEDFDFNSPETCGDCSNVCEAENATMLCNAGLCAFGECGDGWIDLNDDLDDGCEYRCEATELADEEIPCDGQDNNCDGMIDEGSGAGEACTLGDSLMGTTSCTMGSLQCQVDPNEGDPVPVCGVLAGVLTVAGGPYRINCEEVVVEAGTSLVLEEGVELRSGFAAPVRMLVQGELVSAGATWSGVTLWVQTASGGASLVGDTFVAIAANQEMIRLPNGGQAVLSAENVTLDSDGRSGIKGIVLGGASVQTEAIVWNEGLFLGLDVGVEHGAIGLLTLNGATFENNRTAVALQSSGSMIGLTGGTIRNTSGPNAVGIDAVALNTAASLDGTAFEQRVTDAAVRLDPDLLPSMAFENIVVTDTLSGVHLEGDLDILDEVTLVPLGGALSDYVPVGRVTVAEGATLRAGDTVAWRGLGNSSLNIAGDVVFNGTTVEDVAVEVETTGNASLTGVNFALTGLRSVACLIAVEGDAVFRLEESTLVGLQDSGGLCFQASRQGPFLTNTRIEGFGEGVLLSNLPSRIPISNVTLHNNAVGIRVNGGLAPLVLNNTFSSDAEQQIIALVYDVGNNPGGQVSSNVFDLDSGDLAYHIDPDNLATPGGTVFGPNMWLTTQPIGFLLSGRQTSAVASLYAINELEPLEEPLATIQVPGDLIISEGSRFEVTPLDFQLWTFQGLFGAPGETVLQVEGELELDGPGVLFSDLPIVFKPGSDGSIKSTTMISNRTDFAMIVIEDASPTIGGNGTVDGCSLSGSNRLDVTGISIAAGADAMCQGGSLCPFIAENQFRNLGVGIRVSSRANFTGINDFDDSNPFGDTVPINILEE